MGFEKGNTIGKGRPVGSKNRKKASKAIELERLIKSFINGKHYVYYHINNETEEVFYIGKGKGDRAWSNDRNVLWYKYVDNYSYRVSILCSDLSEEEALAIEKSMIILKQPVTNIDYAI
jgi:hypothetical protein